VWPSRTVAWCAQGIRCGVSQPFHTVSDSLAFLNTSLGSHAGVYPTRASMPPPLSCVRLVFELRLLSYFYFFLCILAVILFALGVRCSLMINLVPPPSLSSDCCCIPAKDWVRCMPLLKVMLLSVLCLGVITALCGIFLGFCQSYRSLDSLWFLGTIYPSIACSVVLVSLFFHF
jgi:hypothetical protein